MPISPPSDFSQARWFVEVLIEEPSGIRAYYSMGPLASWSRARKIVLSWEREHGKGTTNVLVQRIDDRRLHDDASSQP